MLDADRPITSKDQDKLNRFTFAKYLARCITEHNNSDSFVIGLYGGWGAGKTSIINLALEELNYASSNMFDQDRPIILNFSPWSYSGQETLIYNFFRRLSSEMRSADYFKDSTEIINLLELYISFFTNKPIPKVLREDHENIKGWFKRKTTKKYKHGWESGRDLTQVKRELNELLMKRNHKIVIFIDNISRLNDDEVIQVFQMVKSIGNFANTVYVLSMDKAYVKKVINRVHHNEGISYLNKLVQLPFEVPAIAEQDIESILLARLHEVLKFAPFEAWDKDYWSEVYYSSLKHLFKNCRDITRYINTLSFSYPFVVDVVNPVDFFAITAVEVFEPKVFNGIHENKDLFVDLAEHVMRFDKQKLNEDKARVDEVLNRACNIDKDLLLTLLIRIFPRLRSIYQLGQSFYHSEEVARKNKRICAVDVFDIYFRFQIPNDTFSETELDAVSSLAHDKEGFAMALLRINQDDRIPKFLDIFDSKGVAKIKKEHVKNVIETFIDSADLFPPGESTKLNFDNHMRVHRILHQLIRRYDDLDTRFKVLSDAINQAVNSLYIIVLELSEQSREHLENEDTFVPEEQRDFAPNDLYELQKLAVKKIHLWADNDRLIEHPQLMPILAAWKEWGNEDECRHYVEHAVQNDRSLVALLVAALDFPIKEALKSEKKNPDWKKYVDKLSEFVSLDLVTPRAQVLFEDDYFVKLREPEQLAIMIYLDFENPSAIKKNPLYEDGLTLSRSTL